MIWLRAGSTVVGYHTFRNKKPPEYGGKSLLLWQRDDIFSTIGDGLKDVISQFLFH